MKEGIEIIMMKKTNDNNDLDKKRRYDESRTICKRKCSEVYYGKCIRVGKNGKAGVCWMERGEGEY